MEDFTKLKTVKYFSLIKTKEGEVKKCFISNKFKDSRDENKITHVKTNIFTPKDNSNAIYVADIDPEKTLEEIVFKTINFNTYKNDMGELCISRTGILMSFKQ